MGFRLLPTCTAQIPFLRIPIDHFLISRSVNVENWIRGPDVGSDHFSILVDFSIQETPEQWLSAQKKTASRDVWSTQRAVFEGGGNLACKRRKNRGSFHAPG